MFSVSLSSISAFSLFVSFSASCFIFCSFFLSVSCCCCCFSSSASAFCFCFSFFDFTFSSTSWVANAFSSNFCSANLAAATALFSSSSSLPRSSFFCSSSACMTASASSFTRKSHTPFPLFLYHSKGFGGLNGGSAIRLSSEAMPRSMNHVSINIFCSISSVAATQRSNSCSARNKSMVKALRGHCPQSLWDPCNERRIMPSGQELTRQVLYFGQPLEQYFLY